MVTFAIIVKHIVHIRDFPTWRDFGQSRQQLLEKREPEVVLFQKNIFEVVFSYLKFFFLFLDSKQRFVNIV